MRTAGALMLVVWFAMVVALCLVPVQPDGGARGLECRAPVVNFHATHPYLTIGVATTGSESFFAASCRVDSGLRVAAASLVGGGGLAGGVVLLRVARPRGYVSAPPARSH